MLAALQTVRRIAVKPMMTQACKTTKAPGPG